MPLDLLNNEEDDQKKQAQAQGATTPQGPNNPGSNAAASAGSVYGGSGGSSAGSGPATGNTSAPKHNGTGFTNLSKILGANQNNQLGQAVGGGVQNAVDQAKGNVQQGFQSFQDQAAQGNLNSDANKQQVNSTLGGLGFDTSSNFGGSQTPPQNVNTTGQGPNAQAAVVPPSSQTVSQFQNFLGGQYSGPQQLDNYAKLQAQANSAQALGQNSGTEAGRLALLQRFAGGKNYTQGQQQLDSLLLGGTAQNQLNQARRASTGLSDYAQRQNDLSQNLAKQYTGESQQFGKDTLSALQGATGQEQQGLDTLTGQQQQRYGDEYNVLGKELDTGRLTGDLIGKLGLTEGERAYGTNLRDALETYDPNIQKATNQNVASTNDYAKIQALSQLGGNKLAGTDQGGYLQKFTDPSQAGTFQKQSAMDLLTNHNNIQKQIDQNKAAHADSDAAMIGENTRISGLGDLDKSIQGLQNYQSQVGQQQSQLDQLIGQYGADPTHGGTASTAANVAAKQQIDALKNQISSGQQDASNNFFSNINNNTALAGSQAWQKQLSGMNWSPTGGKTYQDALNAIGGISSAQKAALAQEQSELAANKALQGQQVTRLSGNGLENLSQLKQLLGIA